MPEWPIIIVLSNERPAETVTTISMIGEQVYVICIQIDALLQLYNQNNMLLILTIGHIFIKIHYFAAMSYYHTSLYLEFHGHTIVGIYF